MLWIMSVIRGSSIRKEAESFEVILVFHPVRKIGGLIISDHRRRVKRRLKYSLN